MSYTTICTNIPMFSFQKDQLHIFYSLCKIFSTWGKRLRHSGKNAILGSRDTQVWTLPLPPPCSVSVEINLSFLIPSLFHLFYFKFFFNLNLKFILKINFIFKLKYNWHHSIVLCPMCLALVCLAGAAEKNVRRYCGQVMDHWLEWMSGILCEIKERQGV